MTIIDVRSPSEYANSTIPGSINIPIFDDKERAEIGTLYKQVSSDVAQERGLEIVSAKLPAFVKQFKEIEGEKTVFCWRGGMRSKTTATVLDLMNIHVNRLDGGVRAYRKWVVDRLTNLNFTPKVYVLNGYTGTGKTLILRRLEEEGYPVLDLEKMANHRGSIFGQIGLEPHNQKTFDSLLVEQLQQLQHSPYVLFEGESKRIGKVVLPPLFNELKEEGFQLIIQMPIEERTRHILEDYCPWDHHEACMEAFRKIKLRIHTPIAAQIEESLRSKEYALAVNLLLEHYYDPRYEHTAEKYLENQKMNLQVENVEEAIQAIKEVISQSPENVNNLRKIRS